METSEVFGDAGNVNGAAIAEKCRPLSKSGGELCGTQQFRPFWGLQPGDPEDGQLGRHPHTHVHSGTTLHGGEGGQHPGVH